VVSEVEVLPALCTCLHVRLFVRVSADRLGLSRSQLAWLGDCLVSLTDFLGTPNTPVTKMVKSIRLVFSR